ncbi:MAG: hypothetical protein ABEJ07_01320 [Candidatus Nanohaloarchaea archaeon]
MKREAIRGAALGMIFSGIAYLVVRFSGYGWRSLTVLLYLYVFMGATISAAGSFDILDSSIAEIFDRVVLVAEREELVLRKLVSGEKYRVEGELEKL